ncbi:LPS export ABC transporter permease LptF [Roseateles sp.]|uniref:LPS export ABC transporter permease LptF n=1 Tax=Roseateles sp. TaxID=1971397 RepID=UPI003957F33A
MLFDTSTRADLARSFGVTLVVILTIVLTSTLIRTLGQAAGGNVAPQDVILLMGYATLAHLGTILILSLFLAIVLTLGRLYRESEMTVWFASGVPLTRFVRPVVQMAWPILLAVIVLELLIWPWGNQNSAELRDRYQRRGDLSRVAPGQFQTSRDGSRVFFIERDGEDATTGRNVFILGQAGRDGERESVTTAARGRLEMQGDDRFLVLDHGQRNEANAHTAAKSMARFDQYRVMTDPGVLSGATQLPPKAVATLELLRHRSPRNDGELAWRFGLILACVNMSLLALGLSASNPRRASNWNLLFALLAFVVYFNLLNLSLSWVAREKLSLVAALARVHGSALIVALGLLWWRDQGARFNPRWRRSLA